MIEVPVGTLVYGQETEEVLADLIRDGQEVLILEGGKGGKGNQHFATPTNRAPRKAQLGTPGQQKRLFLSLKYLADIGIIGLPNAGKSTLLSRLTDARPRIADYPFTTLAPILGVLSLEEGKTLTLPDIPGLIEGASEGRGLGHDFLKHAERTRLYLHILDMTYAPVQDTLEDFYVVMQELENYNPALAQKEQIVLLNKMDLYPSGCRDREELKRSLHDLGLESFFISALTGQGLGPLKQALSRKFFHG